MLAPGGVAQLLGNWELHDGQSWSQRLEGWLEGTGLDAWVVQREVADPALYAETWIRDGGQKAGPRFDELYAAWLDDFDARGVTGVGFGVVTLRRPSGRARRCAGSRRTSPRSATPSARSSPAAWPRTTASLRWRTWAT